MIKEIKVPNTIPLPQRYGEINMCGYDSTNIIFYPYNDLEMGDVGKVMTSMESAQGYADNCVREALKKAARICWSYHTNTEMFDEDEKDKWIQRIQKEILKLHDEVGK